MSSSVAIRRHNFNRFKSYVTSYATAALAALAVSSTPTDVVTPIPQVIPDSSVTAVLISSMYEAHFAGAHSYCSKFVIGGCSHIDRTVRLTSRLQGNTSIMRLSL